MTLIDVVICIKKHGITEVSGCRSSIQANAHPAEPTPEKGD